MAREATQDRDEGWPDWAKLGVTALLLVHASAVLAAAMAAPPSSELQRRIAGQFRWYHQLFDQAHSYRFYTRGAPPTPILFAELQFEDGRAETIRIPDRSQRPRLRFQRHLAIAYHLSGDVLRAGRDETGRSRSRWAASYARHLCEANPGCRRVTLWLEDHLTPSPRELVEAAKAGEVLDVEQRRFYVRRPTIGVYQCDD